MAKKTINVLASDFEGNSHMNLKDGMEGCPITMGFARAGISNDDGWKAEGVMDIDYKVMEMFQGHIPIEDFSFEIEI